MNSKHFITVLVALAALGGCRSTHSTTALSGNRPAALPATSLVDTQNASDAKQSSPLVTPVGFSEDVAPKKLTTKLASSMVPVEFSDVLLAEQVQLDEGGTFDLPEIQQMALAVNPAIAQAMAEIESLRGKHRQAGLAPNPTAGITAQDINEGGGSGKYGVYFGRKVIRGNKLGLAQSAVCAEIDAAEQRLAVIQQRLQTDVHQRYYNLLVAQEKVATAAELVQISREAVAVSSKLHEAQEAARTSVLQSELELQNVLVVKRQAENEQLAARRQLAALFGELDLPAISVSGNPREILELEGFERSFEQLVDSSPEIAALFADVEQAKRQHARECAEPISDVTWQTTLLLDSVNNDVVAGVQIGMPIPTLNRNQGAIYQARQQIVVAERKAEKKALDLRRRLATAYENYLDAKLQIDAYNAEILPKAKETFHLISMGYEQGEIDFLQLLTAQRTYSQINLAYLEKLRQSWWESSNIKGMLLSGSLD